MELSDLKIIISEEIGKAEITNVVLVFKEVLKDLTETHNDFVRERSRFNLLKKDYNRGDMPYDRYIIERNKIIESLTELQNQMIEDDLKDDWISFPVVQSYVEIEEDDDLQTIEIGKYSQIVLTQNGYGNVSSKSLSIDEFEELETMLIKTQDAVEVESYDEAENFCLQAKEIDRKNPQVYEYLALIYFKRMPAYEIVNGAIYGTDKKRTLKHIFQYIRRFNQFSHSYRDDAINFARENIRTIGVLITESIKAVYQKIPNDKRDLIWKCLEFYKDVYELLEKPTSFLDSAILELSGAGKVLWLRVEKGRVKNRYGRKNNALALRKDFIEKLLNDYLEKGVTEEEAIKKTEKRLANNFYYKIYRNYNRVTQVKDSKTGRGSWTDQGRKDIIQFLNASKLGYLLFEDSKYLEEPIKLRFIEKSYKEIIGKGKPFLYWLSLSNNGQLQTYYKSSKLNFHALNELEFLAKKMNLNFNKLKLELKNNLFEIQLRLAGRQYNNVSKELKKAKPDMDKARENLVNYLQRQLVLARQNIGIVEEHIETPLKELTGNGFFNDWIQINSDGNLENTPNSKTFKIDAASLLKEYLFCKKDLLYNFKDLGQPFFVNLFNVNLTNYQDLIKNNPVFLSEDGGLQIVEILKNFELTFFATANTDYLKPLYEELSSSKWVFKDSNGYKNQPLCNLIGFDASKYLNKIINIIKIIKKQGT